MSRSNSRGAPPFTAQGSAKFGASVTKEPQEKPSELMADARKGFTLDEPPKRQKVDKTAQDQLALQTASVAAAQSTNNVAQAFAKLGHSYVSEQEIVSWTTCTREENNAALTKCLAEAWIRQASYHKENKHSASQLDRLDKENKGLKYKQLDHVNELTKLSEAHKEELKRETGSLRVARKRVAELEKSEGSLVKERDGLTKEAAALKAEKETLVAKALVEGQVTFMKSFMRQLPNFDWG